MNRRYHVICTYGTDHTHTGVYSSEGEAEEAAIADAIDKRGHLDEYGDWQVVKVVVEEII